MGGWRLERPRHRASTKCLSMGHRSYWKDVPPPQSYGGGAFQCPCAGSHLCLRKSEAQIRYLIGQRLAETERRGRQKEGKGKEIGPRGRSWALPAQHCPRPHPSSLRAFCLLVRLGAQTLFSEESFPWGLTASLENQHRRSREEAPSLPKAPEKRTQCPAFLRLPGVRKGTGTRSENATRKGWATSLS